jgi:hypothetical protein
MATYPNECPVGHSFTASMPGAECPICASAGLRSGLAEVRKTTAIYDDQDDYPVPLATGSVHPAASGSGQGTVNIWNDSFGKVEPVVGWLVATHGVLRGRDFRIPMGRSSFGRDPGSRIVIAGDSSISARQGFINYSRNRRFTISPGDGTVLIYLNGEEVLAPMELKPYDTIEMGLSTFAFVAFCGPDFDWAPPESVDAGA